MDGILNIHKKTGMTSHDVVARVRKILGQRSVGHAGTLDPAASGVLPICVGQGTRVAEYLSESGKAYRATIIFGVETDTYDAEGQIIGTASIDQLTLNDIANALPAFLGRQMQMPPVYSAIKIQGQPAYRRVRAGETITLEARSIEIERLAIIDWQSPVLTLDIECSKGTYIRSLAHDLGKVLDCGGHLGGLVRTRSGPFELATSITLEEVAAAREQGSLDSHLRSPDSVLAHYPELHLSESESERILHGNPFEYEIVEEERSLARVYDWQGRFIAIATWKPEWQKWQPKKVFHPS